MRIVRAGVRPSRAAAAWSSVVLNGVGGLTVRRLALDRRDRPARGACDRGHRALGVLDALEAVDGVPRRELRRRVTAAREGALHLPVGLGYERLALALPLDDERERRRLHATGGAHVAVAGELGHREIPREHGAPYQVDVLARLACLREAVVYASEPGERALDLLFRDRREPRTPDRRRLVHRLHEPAGIAADELALAVEVGGDHDLVGLLGDLLQRADELALGRDLADRRPHEVRQRCELPGLEVDAVGRERLAPLGPRRRGQRVRQLRRRRLLVLPDRAPARRL